MEQTQQTQTAERTKPKNFYEATKQYTYYFIIGIVSFISVVFLPMVGSEAGLGWALPDTTVGWFVWATSRLIIAVINVLIFYSFMEQGRVNVREHPNYIKANEILNKSKHHALEVPESPQKWKAKAYGKKGTTIFTSSALSVVAFSQAILQYQWNTMLGYIFTIVMGLMFGIMQMKKSEAYWSDEYYRYALMIQEKENKENKEKETEECSQKMENNTEI